MIKAAVLGYGTVGSGVYEVITTNQEVINKRVGDRLEVKYVLDLREFPGDPVEKVLIHDYEIIVNDPEIAIVVETMGGLKPAYEFTKRALQAGKSVCTSNKELVANHGTELLAIAKANKCSYLYEASCGGGIPIIRPLHTSLTGDVVDAISGILNGTTNYILSKMASEGSEFDNVLKEAQDKGYAERNPEADIEGHDARRKIAILSSVAYGKFIDFNDVYTEGITKISASDIKYAQSIGAAIKLLGTSKMTAEGCYAMVSPVMIDASNPLFHVNDVFNGIFVHGNMLGDSMFYGSGAGKLPTASAVVGDLVDCAKHLGEYISPDWTEEKLELMDIGKVTSKFFVRMKGEVSENLEKAEAAFGKLSVITVPGLAGEFAFITEEMTEASYLEKAAGFENIINRIRVAM